MHNIKEILVNSVFLERFGDTVCAGSFTLNHATFAVHFLPKEVPEKLQVIPAGIFKLTCQFVYRAVKEFQKIAVVRIEEVGKIPFRI